MNNFNKSVLAVFMISLFSMVSIQSINRIMVNSDAQVLGLTSTKLAPGPEPTTYSTPTPPRATPTRMPPTPTSPPQGGNGVPCAVFTSLQTLYCPTTTSPTPTPVSCQTNCAWGYCQTPGQTQCVQGRTLLCQKIVLCNGNQVYCYNPTDATCAQTTPTPAPSNYPTSTPKPSYYPTPTRTSTPTPTLPVR